MANNSHVNKVVYGNETVIDITDSTITSDNVLMGYEGYSASGSKIQGNVGLKVEGDTLIANGPIFSVDGETFVIAEKVEDNTLILV